MRKECLFKFSGTKSSVVGLIVTSNEEFDFFTGWEDSDSKEAVSEVSDADESSVITIKNFKGVSEVKIALKGQSGLVGLEFTLVVDHFTEAVDKLVFFVQMKERLSARGKSWVRR
jgi:hypothetical protein